jgi:hypothetical protein
MPSECASLLVEKVASYYRVFHKLEAQNHPSSPTARGSFSFPPITQTSFLFNKAFIYYQYSDQRVQHDNWPSDRRVFTGTDIVRKLLFESPIRAQENALITRLVGIGICEVAFDRQKIQLITCPTIKALRRLGGYVHSPRESRPNIAKYIELEI